MPRKNIPLEREVLADIRASFARIPWLLVWHNKERFIETPDGQTQWVPGLCEGSADLVGIIRMPDWEGDRYRNGLFLAIEVKRPGESPREEQRAFLDRVQCMGGIAGWCSSVAGAVELVYSARGHRAEDLAELNAACAAVRARRVRAPVKVAP